MDQAQERLVTAVARRFLEGREGLRIERLGEGIINDTYLVQGHGRSVVLQRINGHVFPRPELVVENFATVTAHLAGRDRAGCPQWRDLRLIPTVEGRPFFRDEQGAVWRAQNCLEDTVTVSTLRSPEEARQVGWALGTFHRLVAGLPAACLHETLPGFHVLASYLAQYDRARHLRPVRSCAEIRFATGMVDTYRGRMHALGQAEAQGRLVPRIIHGDPKAANVLFDRQSGRAVCLIDLDTVRPGLLLYDIGDCLRSCCNPAGELGDTDAVRFDAGLAREILAGYYQGAGHLVTPADKAAVYEAVCLLSFELGLRFLTDYLDGNRYFKIEKAEDNLQRAIRQFQLLLSLAALGDIFQ